MIGAAVTVNIGRPATMTTRTMTDTVTMITAAVIQAHPGLGIPEM
jgi:hypothetical protein